MGASSAPSIGLPATDQESFGTATACRISEGVALGLRRLLQEAGIHLERDRVDIAPVAPSAATRVNFGVTAANALEEGRIDGFWANGMGTEVAVQRGAGAVVLDVRWGDGPPQAFNYTMASVAATETFIERSPSAAAAFVRALVKTQKALKQDYRLAAAVGEKLFPPSEAALIAELIRGDLPFYDATISEAAVRGNERRRPRPRPPERTTGLFRRRRDSVRTPLGRLSRSHTP
jgi:ABC-type nitrate/sulfonate/bicarbonate transport system substrate-binding protein